MPRPATGSVRWEGGRWKARITRPNGTRVLVDIEPPLCRRADKEKALEEAKALSALARDPALFVESAPAAELARDWFDRWLAAKRARGQTSVRQSGSHYRIHLDAIIGDTPMAQVTPRQIERIVQELDAKVAKGTIKWKMANNVWSTVSKAFDDAHRSKALDLRVRGDNPTKAVRPPDRGVETEQVHLFPSEFLRLVGCSAVPLARRRYYAIATYCYLRPGELEALRWEDVDLERRVVQIRRTIDRDTDTEKSPKAGRARPPFVLEEALLPLLRRMHRESGGVGRVVGDVGDDTALAYWLRGDLLTAGVTRAELHVRSSDPPREWMTMHGCRHTGITWMAVRGDEPLVIMARAGHREMKTTLSYVSRAALVRSTYGEVFPKLPPALLASGNGRSSGSGFAARGKTRPEGGRPRGVRNDGQVRVDGNRREDPVRQETPMPVVVVLKPRGTRMSAETPAEWNPARIALGKRLALALKRAVERGDTDVARALLQELDGLVPRGQTHESPATLSGSGAS